MNDPFEKRIRAAGIAGWWVVLIAAGFLTLSWLVYLAVMNARPEWMRRLVGARSHLGLPPDPSGSMGHRGFQVLRLAHGIGGPLADALGEAVA